MSITRTFIEWPFVGRVVASPRFPHLLFGQDCIVPPDRCCELEKSRSFHLSRCCAEPVGCRDQAICLPLDLSVIAVTDRSYLWQETSSGRQCGASSSRIAAGLQSG